MRTGNSKKNKVIRQLKDIAYELRDTAAMLLGAVLDSKKNDKINIKIGDRVSQIWVRVKWEQ